MFSWLLDLVGTDNKPELTVSALDNENLSYFLVFIVLFLIGLCIFFFIKYRMLKDKYEELLFKTQNAKESDE